MATDPSVVPIFNKYKALHLALSGHSLSPADPPIELDGAVIAWFIRTPQLTADIDAYNIAHPLFDESEKSGEPVTLEKILEVVERTKERTRV